MLASSAMLPADVSGPSYGTRDLHAGTAVVATSVKRLRPEREVSLGSVEASDPDFSRSCRM